MNNRLNEVLKKVIIENLKGPHVFSEGDGSPFGNIQRSARRSFERAVKKAGLQGLRFFDVRRLFACRLVMGGVDLVTAVELLSHRDLEMTQRYSHPAMEHKRAVVTILDEVTPILTFSSETPQVKFP